MLTYKGQFTQHRQMLTNAINHQIIVFWIFWRHSTTRQNMINWRKKMLSNG